MTNEQRNQLIAACETGDDVRIITIALHVAASCARAKQLDAAIAIKSRIDAVQGQLASEKEYRRERLEVIKAFALYDQGLEERVEYADKIMRANQVAVIPSH